MEEFVAEFLLLNTISMTKEEKTRVKTRAFSLSLISMRERERENETVFVLNIVWPMCHTYFNLNDRSVVVYNLISTTEVS